jgi:penicillin-binding protein 2
MLQREELDLYRWRTSFIGYIVFAVLAVLLFGFWNAQIVQFGYYQQRADKNRIREVPLLAPRGRIYDRERRIIADNRPSYNVILIREDSRHSLEQTAAMLSSGISMTKEEIMERIDRKRREPKFRPIVLKEDVSVADIAYVKAHRYELPEISVEYQPRRRYLEGQLGAHALGYVGEVTEAELMSPEFANAVSGDQVGKTGLEREYNHILDGKDGFKRVIVNSFGREMGQLEEEPYVPGNDLVTTIDLNLQRAAEDMMGDRSGAVIAMDPRSGEVLAMVSRPAFDPNLFATRISATDWNSLITDPRKPMQNRAIQSRFPPGSVFKIFMAAAGLESGTLNALHSTFCPGHATFYGRNFACHKPAGHGYVGLHDAIVNSCNVFFYNVGKDLGIGRISQYATMMGLGRKTGIDLPNEDAGIIPSEAWKQRVYKAKWYDGETISVAIGQGYVSVTLIQAAWAMGGLAAGGRLKQPHFVNPQELKKLKLPAPEILQEEYPISQSTVNIVSTAMWGVVNEEGTGVRAKIEGFDVAGKTGTAQVVGKQANLKGEEYEDNAWFVGFAPHRNPEIVVAAFIEHGGHGGVTAAPVAHAVMETYYKKKIGQFDAKLNAVAAK